MTDNENSFTLDGVDYEAVDEVSWCKECAFYAADYGVCMAEDLIDQYLIPSCQRMRRNDGREVVFKKKVNLEMEKEK